jgi:hypothetical protein
VCSELALGIFALIFFDCFSSRSQPNPLPQPLHELRQADGAHPYQPAVERLECATWKPPRPMGPSSSTWPPCSIDCLVTGGVIEHNPALWVKASR